MFEKKPGWLLLAVVIALSALSWPVHTRILQKQTDTQNQSLLEGVGTDLNRCCCDENSGENCCLNPHDMKVCPKGSKKAQLADCVAEVKKGVEAGDAKKGRPIPYCPDVCCCLGADDDAQCCSNSGTGSSMCGGPLGDWQRSDYHRCIFKENNQLHGECNF